MSFLGGLFKRKPGGTFVGNLLRGAANAVSGGILGNGAMMLKETETTAEANNRLLQGATAGVIAAQDATQNANTTSTDTIQDSIKKGAITEYAKKYGMLLLPFGLIIFIGVWAYKKIRR